MAANVAYGVIVDGKYGQFGTYEIAITAQQVHPASLLVQSKKRNHTEEQ